MCPSALEFGTNSWNRDRKYAPNTYFSFDNNDQEMINSSSAEAVGTFKRSVAPRKRDFSIRHSSVRRSRKNWTSAFQTNMSIRDSWFESQLQQFF